MGRREGVEVDLLPQQCYCSSQRDVLLQKLLNQNKIKAIQFCSATGILMNSLISDASIL